MKSNIQLLKYMLEDIRSVTLKGITGLTKEQLFAEPLPGEYPIGAYLMHLGEADLGWMKTLTGEKQPNDLKQRIFYGKWFDVPAEQYDPPKEPIEPQEYIDAINTVRNRLYDYMDKMTDEDLETKLKVKRKSGEVEITKEWIIYHLIEHEAHTRGQMFLLMRLAGFKSKGENN